MNEFAKVLEFELDDNKEYEMDAINDNVVYAKEAAKYLPRLYYLVAWKDYPKEENTWKPSLAVMHLCKMVSTFYKDHPKQPIATSASLDLVPPMTKLII